MRNAVIRNKIIHDRALEHVSSARALHRQAQEHMQCMQELVSKGMEKLEESKRTWASSRSVQASVKQQVTDMNDDNLEHQCKAHRHAHVTSYTLMYTHVHSWSSTKTSSSRVIMFHETRHYRTALHIRLDRVGTEGGGGVIGHHDHCKAALVEWCAVP